MKLADHLKLHGELVKYSKGDLVFTQGEASHCIYFVQKGFLKAYYITDDGKEMVKSFIAENGFIGSSSSYGSANASCTFSLICIEPSVLLRVKISTLFGILQQEPGTALELIDLLLPVLAKKERREYEFLCLSAEQRYLQIKAKSPQLLDRVTQNDIARYLGITPVALSRIKTRTEGGK